MNLLVLRLELWRSRKLLFWLALTTILYAGFMAAFYPRMAAQAQTVNDMLSMWPKEMRAAFSVEGNLMDLGVFFNAYVFSLVWPIIAALAAIIVPTRTLGVDLERGFLDLSLSTRVSRDRYLVTAIAAQILGLAALAFGMVAAILGAGSLAGVGLDVGRFALVGLMAFAFACAISGATTLMAALTLDRGTAAGAVAGLLVLMYLGQTISKIAPDLQGLSYLTIFHYFMPPPVIDDGTVPVGDLAVLAVLAIACWVAALWWFRRRNVVG